MSVPEREPWGSRVLTVDGGELWIALSPEAVMGRLGGYGEFVELPLVPVAEDEPSRPVRVRILSVVAVGELDKREWLHDALNDAPAWLDVDAS